MRLQVTHQEGEPPDNPNDWNVKSRCISEAIEREVHPIEDLLAFFHHLGWCANREIRVARQNSRVEPSGQQARGMRCCCREQRERRVSRGSDVSTEEQGVKVLGAPTVHGGLVHCLLVKMLDNRVLLDAIPTVLEFPAWFLMFTVLCSGRANNLLSIFGGFGLRTQ